MEDLDLAEFHGMFFDEAAEHLGSMESLLLHIDLNAADTEQLNAIFRAAHSIKGGAAAFGFKDITELTHEMETVFDRVRKGQLPLSKWLVDAFLTSGDILKSMLAARKGVGAAVPEEDLAALCMRLRVFLDPPAADAVASKAAGANNVFELIFGPFDGKCTLQSVESVVAGLKDLGSIEEIGIPAPEATGKRRKTKPSAMRRFRIVTSAGRSELADRIAFVADPERVKVRSVERGIEAALAAPPEEEQPVGAFVDSITPAVSASDAAAEKPADVKVDESMSAARPAAAQGGGDASSIRVSVHKVDQLINLVGELVITQAMLAQTASNADPVLYEALFNGLAQLQRNTRDLQESAMSIRMLPMSFVFGRFPRVVRDVAAKLGKDVELQMIGEATELDKGLIERIVDPLTHLVRNSLDHGIESPEERQAKGKTAKGTITLRAFHRGGSIMVEVIDDGAGLDRERLLAKARERGMSVADSMSDQEVFQLIFEAGFSTAEEVTDVSGRGVGMDVVRRNIRAVGGSVEINSSRGAGTRISIRLPLTLAILDGMSVGVGKEVFIIPLTHITESLQPAKEQIKTIAGLGCVVQVRGDCLPVLALHDVFNLKPSVTDFDKGIMVVLESEGAKTALFVDKLLGQHQVVIKSLETNYRRVHGVSGATIMGDGKVALILDVAGLINAPRSIYPPGAPMSAPRPYAAAVSK